MPAKKTRILVPSSPRKASGGTDSSSFFDVEEDRPLNRFGSLSEPRRRALRAFLSSINGEGHAQSVLRLNGKALERAKNTNLAFRSSPLMRAIERERGPFFSSLDAGSLEASHQRRLKEEMLIVCPLLGILAPDDMIPEYRCPIGAQIPGWGSLHEYWKAKLPPVLKRICRDRVVWSFLPNRMRALWTPSPRQGAIITVSFGKISDSGELKLAHAAAQGLSGEMVRWMLERDCTSAESVHSFVSSQGHRFAPEYEERAPGRHNLVFVT